MATGEKSRSFSPLLSRNRFSSLPNFYPFIVNDPGEGSNAKRRSQAVIIDHLTPPMTRAELYGDWEKLESLIDEYYQAESLDPSRLALIRERINDLVAKTNLDRELGTISRASALRPALPLVNFSPSWMVISVNSRKHNPRRFTYLRSMSPGSAVN